MVLCLLVRATVPVALAAWAGCGTSGGNPYRRDVDELARVTAADVARVARRIVDPTREVLAVVGSATERAWW